ncbi:response regulator [Massilia forsythiae]|uniref:Sensory/regulatory protein RpfC n=1 Tax=Massilia forsythiae TaxID=2728020 RepID=A0A7Z2ZR07_9BURK|nr:response regulator [Massilia forsythiae]QJD98658.1 response regulator [Massilia forsythiae]
MPKFARSSLNQKLTGICLTAAASALLVAYLAFAVTSVLGHLQAQRLQLATLAGVVSANSLDALRSKDRRLAFQVLATLREQDNVTLAVLYDRNGRPFADWRPGQAAPVFAQAALPKREPERKAGRRAAPARDADDGASLATGAGGAALPPAPPFDREALLEANLAGGRAWLPAMRVYRAAGADDGEDKGAGDAAVPAGLVMIEADQVPVWLDLLRALSVMGAAMMVALGTALVLARRVRRNIADPVAKLINAAQKVSASQNYTLRIAHQRTDELGTLIDSFNNMLAQVEGRGQALTHHRDELERQVGVRTEQLEKAKNAAEAASRAKSAFLATMSHEIRTPMNGVLGMTEMLLGTELSDTQRNYTRLVKQSGEHLLVIINDILDFSKIEAGKLTVEYINFNLWDLLDDIHTVYTPQAEAKGILLHFDIANDIPVAICGDPNRLRQIMANLLGNAIKFTEQGRILATVRIASEDNQAVMLRFEVHDTGIGISREARGRIFDAFSQADDSTTRKYGGTGLGLAISKLLVELMGGAIGVENALSQGTVTQGTVFWFTVAFDKRRVDPDAPGDHQHTIDGLRVLVVDEREGSRIGLERHLAAWRVECDGAESADEARERLHEAARDGRPYDAALLDMELEHTSGLLLAAGIKGNAGTRATRLILLSPEKLAADPVQRRQAGVAYQLIKPARAADLFACLATRPRGQVAPAARFVPSAPLVRDDDLQRVRRVLLAEDNPVNIEVARAMLESLDLRVDAVHNGEQALQALRDTPDDHYDAVLMDCQMPVMDGFAATATIRRDEREAGHGRILPIIAITANALQGDREACLAAGMDDYLSKPFTQQELAAVLGRWMALPLAGSVHHDDAPPRLPPESVEVIQRDVINRGALEKIRMLSRERGDALVQKVVSVYVDDTPQQLRTLRRAIDGLDTGNVRRIAHTLKSASANVGADVLAALCKDLEHLGRTDTTEGADAILTDMEHEFQSVRHSLTAILEKET